MNNILSINVRKEFEQKHFQAASTKFIQDKKALQYDPNLLNENLKNIRLKGELDRLRDLSQGSD